MATYAACLTPPGSGAIAVIALYGPDAWTVARSLFRPAATPDAPLPEQVPTPRFWFGKLTGEAADEVVLAVRQLEPVPSVEIQCHGGRQVVALILEVLAGCGLQVCSWQELERFTGEDPLRVLALSSLANAPTTRTAAILLDQYHGAFAQARDEVLAALQQGDIAGAAQLLKALVPRCPLGRHLTEPWRVVIAGPPNVGKSSLINALAGYQRSIVSPIPGTTRDVVSTIIAIDGWPIELTDTAGLRSSQEDLERQGVERARQAVAGADLCVWLFDASTSPVWPPEEARSPLLVINKIDLPAAWPVENVAAAVQVSALSGVGLEKLSSAISGRLVPEPPPAESGVPFTGDLCDAIEGVSRLLQLGESEKAAGLLKDCDR